MERGVADRGAAEVDRLVLRARAGDRAAFGELYEHYIDRVFIYLKLVFKDAHEARDAAQEVFIRVLEALPRYEIRGAPFEAWLFRVARNYSTNRLRKLGRTEVEEPEQIARMLDGEAETAAEIEPEALRRLSDKDLLVFVQCLPLAQRQVIVLRYMLDLEIAEVAQILGRSPNAIRQLQGRALAFFRARLEAMADQVKTPHDHRPAAPVRRIPRQAVVVRARKYMLSR